MGPTPASELEDKKGKSILSNWQCSTAKQTPSSPHPTPLCYPQPQLPPQQPLLLGEAKTRVTGKAPKSKPCPAAGCVRFAAALPEVTGWEEGPTEEMNFFQAILPVPFLTRSLSVLCCDLFHLVSFLPSSLTHSLACTYAFSTPPPQKTNPVRMPHDLRFIFYPETYLPLAI